VRYATDGMAASAPLGSRLWRSALLERERQSVSIHTHTLRGSELPPPRASRERTFLHGFLMPFSLIAATLRQPTLGMAYLRVTVVRVLIVGLLACLAVRLPTQTGTKPAMTERPSSGHLGPKPPGPPQDPAEGAAQIREGLKGLEDGEDFAGKQTLIQKLRGTADARAVLSLPGLYLLARPIIPVAAGRLCAESDPRDRFSA
jgi:hypothetical protein